MKTRVLMPALALTLALSACGGGGGGDDAPLGTAEGIWGGTTSAGLLTALMVLETGETWGIYAGPATAGLLYGRTSTNNDQVSGSVTDFNLLTAATLPTSYAGTYVPRRFMNLTISPSGATLAATYDASYDIPVNMLNVAGQYVTELVTAQGLDETANLQVDSSGNVVVTMTQVGCSAAGTVTPRTSGKAILNLSLTFSGTGCLLPANTLITGVVQSGSNELAGVGLNADMTQGLLLYAQKPL